MNNALIDLQIACKEPKNLPNITQIQTWLNAVIAMFMDQAELTIRFVDADESQSLNHTYRNKNNPTNVLSFPFDAPIDMETTLLGDLVICKQIVEQEASAQNKAYNDHYAHMIVHGALHLLGYDHLTAPEANEMEALEIEILQQLGIDNPYEISD